jgi:hypothetical protein
MIFPILDMKYDAKTDIKKKIVHNENIETESNLRNQYYAYATGQITSVTIKLLVIYTSR